MVPSWLLIPGDWPKELSLAALFSYGAIFPCDPKFELVVPRMKSLLKVA